MTFGRTIRHLGKCGMTKKTINSNYKSEETNEKILIAVVHSLQEPWLTITKLGQFQTWIKRVDTEKFRVIHFYATPPNNLTNRLDKLNENLRWRRGGLISRIRNRVGHVLLFPLIYWIPKYGPGSIENINPAPTAIRIKLLDMYATTRWKRLAIIKYFLTETNCDFLLMTTSSSYLRPELLLTKLEKFQKSKIYAGSLIPLSSNSKFCSGAQTVLNRAAATEILRNRTKIPVELLDDLGLGVACAQLGIEANELGTINIDSVDSLKEIPIKFLKENHHFRLKSEKNGTRMDVEIFHELHRKILCIEAAE